MQYQKGDEGGARPGPLPAIPREGLATILNAAHDVYFVLAAEFKTILYVNEAVERVLGYGAETLLGAPFETLLCESAPDYLEHSQFSDGVFGPVGFLRADGRTCLGDVTASAIPWEGAPAVLYTLRDATQRNALEEEKAALIHDLQQVLAAVQRLSGLLPICASCKRIRDDEGYWETVEQYIGTHADVRFSHGICPACRDLLYPDVAAHRHVDGPSAREDDGGEIRFRRAVTAMAGYTGSVGRVMQLQLYALRQQATLGDCAVAHIDFTDGTSRARIDSWKALRGMAPARARAEFARLVSGLVGSIS